jgi:hypothetical protein
VEGDCLAPLAKGRDIIGPYPPGIDVQGNSATS